MTVSAALGSVAAYAIVQSAQNRERERRSRKLALELATIGPYLALLPEDAQIEVKKNLADAWFGQPLTPIEETGGAHAASIPVTELIQILLKMANKT